MPFSALEEKLKQLPEAYFIEVASFIDSLQSKILAEQNSKKPKRQLGGYEGQIWIADDFDAPLEEFKEYM